MFARIVELTCYSGQTEELCRTVDEKILPILKKQRGFRDAITLASNNDPTRVLGISFWNSREDAECYNRQEYSIIVERLRNFCRSDPRVETFDVESSTTHSISMGKAA
jgi:heme-degrading monooxygenase HmoA